jgi:hypothetical protein
MCFFLVLLATIVEVGYLTVLDPWWRLIAMLVMEVLSLKEIGQCVRQIWR